MIKCDICGYEVRPFGTCLRTCKYDKRSGRIGFGKCCHTGCAEKHFLDHHDERNPRSLASLCHYDRSTTTVACEAKENT